MERIKICEYCSGYGEVYEFPNDEDLQMCYECLGKGYTKDELEEEDNGE